MPGAVKDVTSGRPPASPKAFPASGAEAWAPASRWRRREGRAPGGTASGPWDPGTKGRRRGCRCPPLEARGSASPRPRSLLRLEAAAPGTVSDSAQRAGREGDSWELRLWPKPVAVAPPHWGSAGPSSGWDTLRVAGAGREGKRPGDVWTSLFFACGLLPPAAPRPRPLRPLGRTWGSSSSVTMAAPGQGFVSVVVSLRESVKCPAFSGRWRADSFSGRWLLMGALLVTLNRKSSELLEEAGLYNGGLARGGGGSGGGRPGPRCTRREGARPSGPARQRVGGVKRSSVETFRPSALCRGLAVRIPPGRQDRGVASQSRRPRSSRVWPQVALEPSEGAREPVPGVWTPPRPGSAQLAGAGLPPLGAHLPAAGSV